MKNKQHGYFNAYLIAASLLMSMVVAYIAAAERGLVSNWLAGESAEVYAKQIIRSGSALHRASIVFWQENAPEVPIQLNSAEQGLYNPRLALLPAQMAPAGATKSNTARAFVAEGSTFKVNPSGASADLIVAVADLTDPVCKRINAMLHADIQIDPIATRKLEGCGRIQLACMSQPSNVYFKVIMPRSQVGGVPTPSPDCQ